MTQPNLKKIKDLSLLINKYVKGMRWKPMWGLPYDSFLWSITKEWAEECSLDMGWADPKDIWELSVEVATQVENITNG